MSGIFGIKTKDTGAQNYAYFALYALQHRGQTGCGMAANKNGYIDYHKEMGVADQAFKKKDLDKLKSELCLAQVDSRQENVNHETIGPYMVGNNTTSFSIAFDGSILNRDELFEKYNLDKNIADGRLMGELIANVQLEDIITAATIAVREVVGSFSFIILTHDALIGLRDPYGVKMLSVGQLDDAFMLSTETCAFESLGAKTLKEVEPGEMVIIAGDMAAYIQVLPKKDVKPCLFEIIYSSRPDSQLHDKSIYSMRKMIGKQLAKKAPAEADMVISAPDSGTVAAMGYADEIGLPYNMGIIRNRYIGRTFIEPDKDRRDMAVQIKLNVIKDTIKGKSVVIVDDSIIRGTTMARVVGMLREAGAKAVHVRIASPLVQYPCKIEVNPSIRDDLLANKLNKEEISKMIGADSLEFLSVEDLLEAVPEDASFCTGCMDGKYPILEVENGTKL